MTTTNPTGRPNRTNPGDRALGYRDEQFRVEVANGDFDFRALELDDPKPTGRQLLTAAGFAPPEEHLIFQVLDDGAIEERRLDETVELRRKGAERFIVFRGDRSYRVEIDRRRFEWGAPELTGMAAKQLIRADPANTGIWLERRDEPDLFIEDGGIVHLAEDGIERLRTGPLDRYEYKVNGKTFFSKERTVDAAELLRAAFAGGAIGQDPDKTGYVMRVPDSDVTFVSGQAVDLDKYNVFRAAPEEGAPFA